METRYQPRRARQSAWKPDVSKIKSIKNIQWIVVAAAVLIVAVLCVILWPRQSEPDTGEPAAVSTYCSVEVSEENKDKIRYEEIQEGGVAQVVYYSLPAETEKELFRIYFGDGGRGDTVGKIQTGDETVWISVEVSSYDETDFADEDELQRYYSLMEEVNVVLNSIRAAEHFVEADRKTPEKTQSVELTYWTFDLPAGITWEENAGKDAYRIDFYGVFDGEKEFLYAVCVGGEQEGTLLGTYIRDGAAREVYVKSNPRAGQIAAENVEFAVMMDTVNDVIQVIASSQGFVRNSSK